MGKWLKFHLLLILIGLAIAVPSVTQEHERLASLYIDQAESSYDRGDGERAFQLLLSALRFMPDNSDAHFLLARLHSRQPGGLYAAVDRCRQALAADIWNRYSPLNCSVLLADLLIRTGQFEEAETVLGDIRPGSDPGAEYYRVMAQASAGVGNTVEAVQLLERSLRRHPDHAALKQHLLKLSSSYRKKLANEYLEGRYQYPHDESVLLDLIKGIEDDEIRQELIDIYRERGGVSPWVDFFQIASAEGESDMQPYLESFYEQGGLEEADLTEALTSLIEDSPGIDYLTEISKEYSGYINVDDNEDGYPEIVYQYEQGLPLRVSIDLDQDGLYEYDAVFSEGIPVTLYGIVEGRAVEVGYTDYPFAETIVVRAADKSVTYSLPPGQFSYPLFDFRFLENPGPLNRPRLNLYRPEVTLDTLVQKASSIKEEFSGTSGTTVLWQYMPDRRSWQKNELDEKGRILKRISYQDGRPVLSNVDTDRDGNFEVTYQYDQGNMTAILFDENGDTIPEYSIIFDDGDIRRWDFNGDSIIDCREEIRNNGEILRSFSSSLNGVFDMEILYKDNKIVWIERDGNRKEVQPDSSKQYFWVGDEVEVDLGSQPPPGTHNAGGVTLSVFNQFGHTYIEVLQ